LIPDRCHHIVVGRQIVDRKRDSAISEPRRVYVDGPAVLGAATPELDRNKCPDRLPGRIELLPDIVGELAVLPCNKKAAVGEPYNARIILVAGRNGIENELRARTWGARVGVKRSVYGRACIGVAAGVSPDHDEAATLERRYVRCKKI